MEKVKSGWIRRESKVGVDLTRSSDHGQQQLRLGIPDDSRSRFAKLSCPLDWRWRQHWPSTILLTLGPVKFSRVEQRPQPPSYLRQ
ncbi:hypothetical protein CDL15_Pgr000358 [Punica granatum]|uniref:Uncharacterized protein n=1 Tax=Punica granatum TaxID=22663 RepID=A0A218XTR8_PUNGR|nr:hypothetical protein CDL15_Pgr000358 [Punica granatum]